MANHSEGFKYRVHLLSTSGVWIYMSKTKYILNIDSPYLSGDSYFVEHRAGDDWLMVELSMYGEDIGRDPNIIMFKEVYRNERNITN